MYYASFNNESPERVSVKREQAPYAVNIEIGGAVLILTATEAKCLLMALNDVCTTKTKLSVYYLTDEY